MAGETLKIIGYERGSSPSFIGPIPIYETKVSGDSAETGAQPPVEDSKTEQTVTTQEVGFGC